MLNWLLKLFTVRYTPHPAAKPAVKPPIVIPAKRSKTGIAVATGSAIAIAVAFVAPFEGYYSHVYRDEVGVKTWCYGRTQSDAPLPKAGSTFTKAECEQLLGIDLVKYQQEVRKCVPKVQPPHREASLISFVYNLGGRALCGAVGRNINSGNIAAGCRAMLGYNHAGGRVLAGLTRRRQAEYQMCIRGD